MSPADALRIWEQLQSACPHGCRVHLTGGEPFGDWPGLIEIARGAHARNLGPLEKVETNAFWATDEAQIRERIIALDEAGMGKLGISADPFHQQFVPIARPRLLARIAGELLGPERVQVRWWDWLESGCDTADLPEDDRRKLFVDWLGTRRDRLNGRAAATLGQLLPLQPPESFAEANCREALLRGRHVHICPDGTVTPGVCAGIMLGRATGAENHSIADIWRQLDGDHAGRAVVGTLAAAGPVGLMELARQHGFAPAAGYASKCHLCWAVRQYLVGKGLFSEELEPSAAEMNF